MAEAIPDMVALSKLLREQRKKGRILCLTDGQMWEAQFVEFGKPAMTEGFTWKSMSMEDAIQGAAELAERGGIPPDMEETPDPPGGNGSLDGGEAARRSMEDHPAPPLLPEG